MDEKYHFIGIGGIGMSALARILLDKQRVVSGSDLCASLNTEDLKKRGATIQTGHDAAHISAESTVIFSSGINEVNPEYKQAKALNCKLLHRSELLCELMRGYRTFLCTGTHGKTTTSALLAAVLIEGGLDPTYAVGGMFKKKNGNLGTTPFFLAEADESDGTFLRYHPEGAIVTNIEPEHMEHFKTVASLHTAFATFLDQVQNTDLLFYCGDDPLLCELAKGRGVSYGFSTHCALKLSNYVQIGWTLYFDLSFEGHTYEKIEVALIGKHNGLNAAAVFGYAIRLGLDETAIRSALKTFPGISRRSQRKKESQSILYLDDYAHHPTEIEKTIESVKEAVKEKRLVVLYEPHRFSRTQETLGRIGKAFESADYVYITDIDPSGEKPIAGVNSQQVVENIQTEGRVPCSYLPKSEWNKIQLQPHDVFLSLGAGSITSIHDDPPSFRKLRVGLVFGGMSPEHEISLRSARFVSQSLDPELYDIQYFGIDQKGKWVVGDRAKESLENSTNIASMHSRSIFDILSELETCDLFLPILHGSYGEDGTIQGFFELLGKPYTGPDHRCAAIALDKALTKRIVASYHINVPKDIVFSHIAWQHDKEIICKNLKQELRFPVYVKPVHLGSSIGISFVTKPCLLEEAIEKACRFDKKIMVEEGKEGCRELEFAVVGNSDAYEVKVPPPGEKLAEGTFVDYEKKYSMHSIPTTVYADLEPQLLEKGKKCAEAAYRALGCSGLSRVDFLLDQEGEFWFFEMNTIPGFQPLSLFPKIWQREGVSSKELLNQLIVLALERHRTAIRLLK